MNSSEFKYLSEVWASFCNWTAGVGISLHGWFAAIVWGAYLPNPVTASALILLWVFDIVTGVALAIRVANWPSDKPKPKYLDRKEAFRWSRLGKATIKLGLWLILASTCMILKVQANATSALFFAVATFLIGMLEWALVSFEAASVLRNVAYWSENVELLRISEFWDRTFKKTLDKMMEEGEQKNDHDAAEAPGVGVRELGEEQVPPVRGDN